MLFIDIIPKKPIEWAELIKGTELRIARVTKSRF